MKKEQKCEKNCDDYRGMEILHKEQCNCSCHKPTTDTSKEWEEQFKTWYNSIYPATWKAHVVITKIEELLSQQKAKHREELVKLMEDIELMERLWLPEHQQHFIALDDIKDQITSLKEENE